MAYTENLPYLDQRLSELGMDIQTAKDVVLSGGPGFGISFGDAPADQIPGIVKQIRTLMYSWLYCMGVKDRYAVKTKQMSVEVALKTPRANYRGKFVIGSAVGNTRMGSRSTVIMAEADAEDWDVMPDETSEHEKDKLFEILDGNEDTFPNDGFEEFKQQKQQGNVMPEDYNPDNIFPVPKPFVTPAGLKSLDDEIELDR